MLQRERLLTDCFIKTITLPFYFFSFFTGTTTIRFNTLKETSKLKGCWISTLNQQRWKLESAPNNQHFRSISNELRWDQAKLMGYLIKIKTFPSLSFVALKHQSMHILIWLNSCGKQEMVEKRADTYRRSTLRRAARSRRSPPPSCCWTPWRHRSSCRTQRTPVSWAPSPRTGGRGRECHLVYWERISISQCIGRALPSRTGGKTDRRKDRRKDRQTERKTERLSTERHTEREHRRRNSITCRTEQVRQSIT